MKSVPSNLRVKFFNFSQKHCKKTVCFYRTLTQCFGFFSLRVLVPLSTSCSLNNRYKERTESPLTNPLSHLLLVAFNFTMTDKRQSPVCNIIMWVCLFIGQGVQVCLYCQEWYAQIHCPRTGVRTPTFDRDLCL